MSWYDPEDLFLDRLIKEISNNVKSKCTIYKEADDTDIWDVNYVVTWKLKKNKFNIIIKISELGPSREYDFLNIFNTKLKNEYPELLL